MLDDGRRRGGMPFPLVQLLLQLKHIYSYTLLYA